MRAVGKYAVYLQLTFVGPLIHRCGGPPSPKGKVGEKLPLRAVRRPPFPVGEGGEKLPLRGSWQGAALTEEGRNGRERPVIV